MKKGLKIGLIIFAVIVLILIAFFLIRNIFGLPFYDKYMFNKAIETGEVKYCHKILDYNVAPGRGTTCVILIAQKNNDSFICENLKTINSLYTEDCYAGYAYYKDDESLCVEPICSKTLFETCKRTGCLTIKDYQ